MDGKAPTRLDFIIAAQPMMDRESAAEGNSTLKRRIRIRTRGQLEEAPDRDDTQMRMEKSDTTRQRKPTGWLDKVRSEEEKHVARIVASLHTSLFVLYEPPSLWSACCLIRSERSNEHAQRCLEDEVQRRGQRTTRTSTHAREHKHAIQRCHRADEHGEHACKLVGSRSYPYG